MGKEPSHVLVTVEVTGMRAGALSAELARFVHVTHHKKFTSSGYGSDPIEWQRHRYVPPTANELRLGIVSDPEEMGAWGLTAPLLLEEALSSLYFSSCESANTSLCSAGDFDTTPVTLCASVKIPTHCISGPHLRYRLVIVDEPLMYAAAISAVNPGAAIVAVENARSQPSLTELRRVPYIYKDMSSDSDDSISEKFALLARIDLSSLDLHFAKASAHFPFLSQLSHSDDVDDNSRGGPLLSLTIYGNDPRVRYDRRKWLDSLPKSSRDVVLFIERTERESGNCRNSPQSLGDEEVINPTTVVEVCDVYPVPSEGCCWSSGVVSPLPPMEQQIRMVKKQLHQPKPNEKATNPPAAAAGGPPPHATLSHTSPTAPLKKFPSCRSLSFASIGDDFIAREVTTAATAFIQRGWCVQPLHAYEPIAPMTRGESVHTMRVWHTTVNVSLLVGCGLQIELMLPIPIYGGKSRVRDNDEYSAKGCDHAPQSSSCWLEGKAEITASAAAWDNSDSSESRGVIGIKWLKGVVMLQPPLFEQRTNGTLVMPVCFHDVTVDSTTGASTTTVHWHTIYLQYLLLYPFVDKRRNTLEVVRSVASRSRLVTKKLVGHRGLGKTYTRGAPDERPENFSFASATESMTSQGGATAASHIDTQTKAGTTKRNKKVPRLMVKLAENSLESLNAAHRRGCDMVEFDVMLTRDRVPIVYHDPLIQLQARRKRGAGTFNGRVNLPGDLPNDHSVNLGFTPPCYFDSLVMQQLSAADSSTESANSVAKNLQGLREYQMYMRDPPQFASVPIALHQLTKSQLDVVITETFTHVKAGNRLRDLILRHWHKILYEYRRGLSKEWLSNHGAHTTTEVQEPDSYSFRSDNRLAKCDGSCNQEKHCDPESAHSHATHHRRCPSIEEYVNTYRKHRRIISQQEDVTNRICTLKELFEGTAPSLRFDLEVKFPFQPIADANLFLQTDSFEVNAFVDDILQVVFAYADQRHTVDDGKGHQVERFRDVIFSSFEPDVCMALELKQSRYHVVYLCDTELHDDFKDYRCFGRVEGALQFSVLMNLAGISIYASSLCTKEQLDELEGIQRSGVAQKNRQLEPTNIQENNEATESDNNGNSTEDEVADTEERLNVFWSNFDCSRGKNIVSYAHARGKQVWTWGETNVDERFRAVQSRHIKVDAIITDSVPKWATDDATPEGTTVST
uniref:GP-PDE domain-containing protein n=1 Tax=Trypanosoma congolense (strain IL3000) TaxID=1068625 RepID=G0UJA0_TRYCI|nr:conserved hypothetical protein [Trypanosoma congolense IL3000]